MPSPTVAPDIDIGQDHDNEDLHAQLYHVVLLDDDEHTYDYVIEMLQTLFFMSLEQAYHHACEVDAAKRTIIMTCELEPAEFAKNQVHSFGADWRMPESQGSMSAIVEPAAVGA
jgi:ATP-dependent Clp protease adaptor protein ClpS